MFFNYVGLMSNMYIIAGILYMGAMSHKARANMISKTVQKCLATPPKKPALPAGAPPKEEEQGEESAQPISQESRAVIQSLKSNGEHVTFSQEVKHVLDTGELSMIRAALVTEGTQTDLGQIWQFGGLSPPEGQTAIMESIPPMIDLRNCDQFSIVKLEDRRDPSSKSLVMVQTNEIGVGGKRPRELEPLEKKPQQLTTPPPPPREPSPMASPIISNSSMSVYVKSTRDAPQQHQPMEMEQSHDMDSGIWDMVKGIESSKASTRESTPNCSRLQKVDGSTSPSTLLDPANPAESCVSPVHMMGTFKAFNVDEKDGGGKPNAEVKFAIHNDERHLESRDISTDTFTSDQYVTAPQTPNEDSRDVFRMTDSAKLTAALETFPFERAIPSSPEPDEDSVSISESEITLEMGETTPEQASRGLNDFMVARERGVIASRSHVEQRTGSSRNFARRNLNESDFSGLNDIEATRHKGVVIRRTHSPTSRARASQGKPLPSRDPARLSPRPHQGSHCSIASADSSFMSEFTDYDDSFLSDSEVLDLSSVPDFERFTDWMAELPELLKNIPLGSLVIPGEWQLLATYID